MSENVSRITHDQLLSLIGEIDGIDLDCSHGWTRVHLRIAGRNVEVIKESGSIICHSVTRIGIATCFERDGVTMPAPGRIQ